MALNQTSGHGIIYRRSPTVEMGSSAHSNHGGLAAGVRGLSGAVTMERSEDEKLKYPDRINLDRKGLHGLLNCISLIRHINCKLIYLQGFQYSRMNQLCVS
jgi:hypothetical protein